MSLFAVFIRKVEDFWAGLGFLGPEFRTWYIPGVDFYF